MKAFFLASAFSCGAALAGILYATSIASPAIQSSRLDTLGAYCEAGQAEACELLVAETGGQCAGPEGSGCRYGLDMK